MPATDKHTGTIICPGKKGYYLRDDARDALEAQRRRYPHKAFTMYRCPVCRLWHVGHDRKTRVIDNTYDKKRMRKHQKYRS